MTTKRSRSIQSCAAAIFLSSVAAILLLFSRAVRAQDKSSQQDNTQPAAAKPASSPRRLGVRLRSFIATARGQMNFEPTPEGGVVRLTVTGLPRPQTIMAGARTFVIWASASGARVVRVGELLTDESGNGGLQFTRPPSLESYSVLVTAEQSAEVEKLTGTVVFASLAGEVKAFFAEVDKTIRKTQRAAAREISRRRRVTDNFFDEVDLAINTAPGGARRIYLFGSDLAPGASGTALATTLSRKAYVRASIQHLPPPILVNAVAYVLWSVVPDGRITYMGSLPTDDLDNTDVYVRVAGFSSDFDLFVTAEQGRPVSRASERRLLTSRPPPRLPQ
ncbi:MAG TPA: hypothetical protein VM911_08330 [Pyrinomonadaceae bacterium]|nr:hypothetical protein [Pyrinomonadaceae bacterium]